jgi:hypothetical protein
MNLDRREYAHGTYLEVAMPWSLYRGGAALCPDGKVRKLARIAESADTWFSVPAAVKAYGKTVAGYVTVETVAGFETVTDDDPAIVKFIPYQYRRNAFVFDRKESDHDAI